MENTKNTKLSQFTKISYGSGTAGDSIPYTLFFTYFIFFLTDVAGISAAVAGAVSFIAIAWQAITGPIFGFISDKSKNPKGRRRPMMIKSLIPYVIILALLFAPVNFGSYGNNVYYCVLAVLLWTLYSAYVNPWTALGAELSQDYKERNVIRFWVGLWAYPYNMVAQSVTIAIVGVVVATGKGAGIGWFVAACVCAIVVLLGSLFSWFATKGKEITIENNPATQDMSEIPSITDFFKEYIALMKIKSLRKLIIYSFVFVIGYMVMMNTIVYILNYNAGMSEASQSAFWMINTVINICMLPVVTIIANKVDKRICVIAFAILYIAGLITVFFIGISDMKSAIFMAIFASAATGSYYGIFYSLIYDCCELYELSTGKRAEGAIVSLNILANTLGTACASLLTGLALSAIGYTGTGVETAATQYKLLGVSTLIPAGVALIALILLLTYKMNGKRFKDVLRAIEDKKSGKEIDLGEFRDLI